MIVNVDVGVGVYVSGRIGARVRVGVNVGDRLTVGVTVGPSVSARNGFCVGTAVLAETTGG